MGGLRQAGFDHRRRGEIGDVEDRPWAVVVVDRFAQHIVGHPRHHAHIRIGFPCQQGDFEIYRVVVTGADHRERVSNLGGVQIVGD
jgi:hypothetical protein